MTDSAWAPGRFGPTSTAAMAPTATRALPVRSMAPTPEPSTASHVVDDAAWWARWASQWARSAATKSPLTPQRCGPAPRAPPKMKSAVAGTRASIGALARNAAVSATKAMTHDAIAHASRKPGSAGAGATTLLNDRHASRSCVCAWASVRDVGMPYVVVSGRWIHESTNTALTTLTAKVAPGPRP